MVRCFGVIALAFLAVVVSSAQGKRRSIIPPAGVKELSEHERRSLPAHRPDHRHRGVTVIPDSFDARTKWPSCQSIKTIRNQGQCGTCWAVSAASVLSDRICIASNQANTGVFISANQAATCSQPTVSPYSACNDGGDASKVYAHAAQFGITTGGEYNSKIGCVPYPVPPNSNPDITCKSSCTNTANPKSITADTYYVDGYWANYKPSSPAMTSSEIAASVETIQKDLLVNGPLTLSMTVYDDFQDWEPSMAPYCSPSAGAANQGGHAVRVIGWGKRSNGVKYWLIANSWGTNTGDQGVFQIEMGKNCVGIERTPSAPMVKVPNSCSAADFCSKPIDQAIPMGTTSSSPVYLFQGNCTMKVTVGTDGKLTPAEAPAPINVKFQGAPAGPITGYIVQSGQIWIFNDAGKAGSNCKLPSGGRSYTCGSGTYSGKGFAQSIIPPTPQKWAYHNDQNPEWIFNTAGQGSYLKDTLTSKFSKVNALLNVDGTKMVVFGVDKAGSASAGVLKYPTGTGSLNPPPTWTVSPGAQSSSAFKTCTAPSG